jgi:hypothetical protein
MNEAIESLEEAGVPLGGARYPLPPRKLWALNDRVEERLAELGIPADLHGSVIAYMSMTFAGEILEKSVALAEKRGIDPEDEDAFEALSRVVALDICCRRIGVEASPDELRWAADFARSMEGPREEAGGNGGNRE